MRSILRTGYVDGGRLGNRFLRQTSGFAGFDQLGDGLCNYFR
jgi:hypothetical protein